MASSKMLELSLLFLVIVAQFYCTTQERDQKFHSFSQKAPSSCQINIAESIPENLTYPKTAPVHMSTFDVWGWLIGNTSNQMNIGSFYWSLLSEDTNITDPSDWEGEAIFSMLGEKLKNSKAFITVVNNGNSTIPYDIQLLKKYNGNLQFYNIDFEKMSGHGILHTKLITRDGVDAYVGSANVDWRSLTQVKELGLYLNNCPELVQDLDKIHKVYSLVANYNSSIPQSWPSSVNTAINISNPYNMVINGVNSSIFIGASPPTFCPPGRNTDFQTLEWVIKKAKKFVYVAVMDYAPIFAFGNINHKFWPEIDDLLRAVAINKGIEVRLLISKWAHTDHDMYKYLWSLTDYNGTKTGYKAIRRHVSINVKYFVVPPLPPNRTIPYTRVNHNKYMVTDTAAYIGTSNWSGDYFEWSAGIGFVVYENEPSQAGIRGQLEAVFQRDWNSPYANQTFFEEDNANNDDYVNNDDYAK